MTPEEGKYLMDSEDRLLKRLGEVRDAIEVARTDQDTAALFALTTERDELKEQLAKHHRPSRENIVAELESLRSQLEGFDPEVGMLTGMSLSGGGQGPGATSASTIAATSRAAEQQRVDAGVSRVEQRIAHLEEQLRKLDSDENGS